MSGAQDDRGTPGLGKNARQWYGLGVVAAAWIGAFALEFLARTLAIVYVPFGADLPTSTVMMMDAVRNYALWVVAVAVTLVVAFLLVTGNRYLVHACAVICTVLAISVGAGTLSLALPAGKMCGNLLPDWPGEKSASARRAGQPEQVVLNTQPQPSAPAPSCR